MSVNFICNSKIPAAYAAAAGAAGIIGYNRQKIMFFMMIIIDNGMIIALLNVIDLLIFLGCALYLKIYKIFYPQAINHITNVIKYSLRVSLNKQCTRMNI
ncbi:TPA: hypothetical protein JFW75_004713 [Salmonella enterica]|nr:hypothetical protein [Salmonella enterica]HAV0414845.1 hypothetical protein [Salmonella enterica]